MPKKIYVIILFSTAVIISAVSYFQFFKTKCTHEIIAAHKEKAGFEAITKCASNGQAEAMITLCDFYLRGEGVDKDVNKAIDYCKQAAVQKNSMAMIELGNIYSSGYLNPKDFNEALKWYQSAIDLKDSNYTNAQYELARYFKRKYLSSKEDNDIKASFDLLTKLAESGYIPAIHDIADFYLNGDYVNKDHFKQKEWLEKAASLGDIKAYRSIGNIYANGYLGVADYFEAANWFQKGAEKGDEYSVKFLKPNPAPFGLEITKATITDFKKIFPKHNAFSGASKYTGGRFFLVYAKDISLKGILGGVLFIFNKNEVLEAIILEMHKSEYYDIKSFLDSKYSQFYTENSYSEGLTLVKLHDYGRGFSVYDKPLFRDSITVMYKSRAFDLYIMRYEDSVRKEDDKKKQKQRDLL